MRQLFIASVAVALLSPVALRAEDAPTVDTAVAKALDQLEKGLKEKKGVIAVPPFRAAGEAKDLEAGKTFTSATLTELKKRGFEVRDPDAVGKILGEAATDAGLGGDLEALDKLASGSGAKVVLIGQLGSLGTNMTINLKALDPTSGEVIGAASTTLPLEVFKKSGGPSAKAYTGGASNESVEVALRRLADEIAHGIRSTTDGGDLRYIRAAVMPFQETGDTARDRELGTVVPSELGTIFRRDHGLLMVERSRLSDVLSEQALGQSGVIDEATAAEVGKVLGVDFLVIGEVAEVGDHYRVNARVISTINAAVIAAANGSLPAAGLIALSADAVVLRSRSGAAFRSLLIPGWGQFYNREPVKGTAFIVAELGLFGTATAFHMLGAAKESEYRLPEAEFRTKYEGQDLSAVAVELREAAESHYTNRNTILYVAAGVWAYNFLDAYLNGVSADSPYAGMMVVPTEDGDGAALVGVGRW